MFNMTFIYFLLCSYSIFGQIVSVLNMDVYDLGYLLEESKANVIFQENREIYIFFGTDSDNVQKINIGNINNGKLNFRLPLNIADEFQYEPINFFSF